MASRLSSFLAELKRRKVYHVAVVYALVGLAVAQGADWAFDLIELPNIASQLVAILIVLGFPIALVLAWAYEVRPEEPGELVTGAASVPRPTSAADRKSIVVLPFDNLSPDPADAYFSDGLTEEIITSLSHLHSLRVISRSSAMSMKGTPKDVRTIGTELDVQYVLEGSVRKAGDSLRITAQLIDAGSDEHLWADRFDGEIGNVFSIQEEFARSIVKALSLRLSPEEDRRLSESPIRDPRAYECYLRARHEALQFSKEGLNRAQRILENGIEIIGQNALLFAALGEVHYHFVDMGMAPDPHASLRIAEQHARDALALNADSAQARRLLGLIDRARGNLRSFLRHFEAARALEENDSYTLWMLAYGLAVYTGKTDLSRPLAQKAIQLDPLEPSVAFGLGMSEWMSGNLEKAESVFDRFLRVDPDAVFLRLWRAHLLVWCGRKAEALKDVEVLLETDPPGILSILAQFFFHALRGEKDAAMEILEGSSRAILMNDPEAPWFLAGYCTLLGEKEEALNLLDRALERDWCNFPLFNELDPLLTVLRGEERYRVFLEEIKRRSDTFRL